MDLEQKRDAGSHVWDSLVPQWMQEVKDHLPFLNAPQRVVHLERTVSNVPEVVASCDLNILNEVILSLESATNCAAFKSTCGEHILACSGVCRLC